MNPQSTGINGNFVANLVVVLNPQAVFIKIMLSISHVGGKFDAQNERYGFRINMMAKVTSLSLFH